MRTLLLATVLGMALSACTGASTGDTDDADPAGAGSESAPGATPGSEAADADGDHTCTPTTDQVEAVEATAGPFPWDDVEAAVIDGFDTSEIISGGPPPDGIRPVDTPCVVPIAAGDEWLGDDDSVLLVEVAGAARAYPLAIMTQHEIVNDVLGGLPVAVTYCPLCNSGLAFERERDGGVWDFGTSGRLLRSNLVMYDRQTRTLWSQFSGQALWGDEDVVGDELVRLPTQLVGWAQFKESFPDGTVLGRDSVEGRTYGRNPYPGYEDSPSRFLFRGELDRRLDPDERVVGLGDEDDAVAVPLAVLREQEALSVPLDGRTVTVVRTPGQASALDDSEVGGGREVGQTGAFAVDDLEPLGDGRFRDPATDAVHDVTGRTVAGDAPDLEPVPLDDTFWFVWFAFVPDTVIAG